MTIESSLRTPEVIHSSDEMRSIVRRAQRAGKTVGLVPTMGALHAGHISLASAAKQQCDLAVATIFVNPTQFAPTEDLAKYPRTLNADLEKLAAIATDFVFVPSADEMYRPGSSTFVEPPAVSLPLEGRCRPGHFRGVATIVLKLFNIVPSDIAFFGHKDYQQSLVIRRMVADLDLDMRIVVCPTVREPDGLAMSSRNVYLSFQERQQATAVSRSLRRAEAMVDEGENNAAAVLVGMRQVLADAGISRIDYLSLADPETLAERTTLEGPTIALIACYVGSTRLIDNLVIR